MNIKHEHKQWNNTPFFEDTNPSQALTPEQIEEIHMCDVA